MQEQPSSLVATDSLEPSGLRKRQAFLDMLLVRHLQTKELTIEEIREEVDTFMLAGHDAIAIGGWMAISERILHNL